MRFSSRRKPKVKACNLSVVVTLQPSRLLWRLRPRASARLLPPPAMRALLPVCWLPNSCPPLWRLRPVLFATFPSTRWSSWGAGTARAALWAALCRIWLRVRFRCMSWRRVWACSFPIIWVRAWKLRIPLPRHNFLQKYKNPLPNVRQGIFYIVKKRQGLGARCPGAGSIRWECMMESAMLRTVSTRILLRWLPGR